MAQMNLGVALSELGEREAGTARLEQAVAAYRLALEERTRERDPLGWATAQNNLGNTVLRVGGGGRGTGGLGGGGGGQRPAPRGRNREPRPDPKGHGPVKPGGGRS